MLKIFHKTVFLLILNIVCVFKSESMIFVPSEHVTGESGSWISVSAEQVADELMLIHSKLAAKYLIEEVVVKNRLCELFIVQGLIFLIIDFHCTYGLVLKQEHLHSLLNKIHDHIYQVIINGDYDDNIKEKAKNYIEVLVNECCRYFPSILTYRCYSNKNFQP